MNSSFASFVSGTFYFKNSVSIQEPSPDQRSFNQRQWIASSHERLCPLNCIYIESSDIRADPSDLQELSMWDTIFYIILDMLNQNSNN